MTVLTTLRRAVAGRFALGKQRRAADAEANGYPWLAEYPREIRWNMELEPRPLYCLLDDAAVAFPGSTCLSFQGKRYSYRKTASLVSKMATGLRRLGIKRGVKVGLLLPNSPYFVIAFHGILKAGGTVVNFNPLYAEGEIGSQIQDSQTSMMITLDSQNLYSKVAKRLDDTCLKTIVVCRVSGMLKFPDNFLSSWLRRNETMSMPTDGRHVRFDSLINNRGLFTSTPIDATRDIAVLQYTGGVTGTSKGAMLTHANLYINALQLRAWATGVKLGEEKCLAVLPLSHAFGMTGIMNFGLSIGAELLLLPRFRAGEVLKVISRQRCTFLFGVPTLYAALSSHRDGQKDDLSSLRYCISGGAPLSAEVRSAFESLVNCSVTDGYGLTEAGPVCTLQPIGSRDQRNSVGLPLPGTVIEIISLANPKRFVPPGELGEICIRGPQVMAGYWQQPQETGAVLDQEARLRTGDFGYLDDQGFLFIVDRIKEMIIAGGFNVYPRMVEEIIRRHPAIDRTAVCGVPDPHRGERVKAYVQLRDGAKLTGFELRGFLKDKLAPFEMPNEIEFVAQIPSELMSRVPRRRLLLEKFSKKKSLKFRIALHPLRDQLLKKWRILFSPSAAKPI